MSASPRPRKAYRWQPTMPAGRVLGWLLVALGALSFVEAAVQLGRAFSATTITDTQSNIMFRMLEALQSPFTFASGPALLACGVLWLIWQHKVHADLWARGAPALRFTPGWAVGWWFVPFANYVQPVRAVRELSRHAGHHHRIEPDAPPAASDGLLALWWGAYLAYGFVAAPSYIILFRAFEPMFRSWSDSPTTIFATVQGSDLRAVAGWLCASMIVRGAAALFAAKIVWTISRAEDAAPLLVGVPPRPDL